MKGVFILLVLTALACAQADPPADEGTSGEAGRREAVGDAPRVGGTLAPYMPTSLAPVVDGALPAVVNISSTRIVRSPDGGSPFFSDPFFRYFFGDRFGSRGVPQERREKSLGSGVIISPDGFVVTNNHVIQDADEISVSWADQEYSAGIVGRDAKTDVALLKIDAQGLPHLPFADSDALRVGDFVLAIGNPFGLERTVTMGIVSAVGRADIGIVDYEDFIQTDAAINPGNSGGALLDLRGGLVGINTAIVSRTGGYQGIGFAIPSAMASRVIESIREYGEVRRGWLGIAVQELTPDLAAALGVERSAGVLVSELFGGGPGDRAGLREGDVIIDIDGHPIRDLMGYRTRVERLLPGATATYAVRRGGDRLAFRVEVGRPPDEPAALQFEELETGPLPGVALETLDAATARQLGYSGRLRGVLIREVDRKSPAARAGLRPGDVIVEVAGRGVSSVKDLERVASRVPKSERLVLIVVRGWNQYYVAVPRE